MSKKRCFINIVVVGILFFVVRCSSVNMTSYSAFDEKNIRDKTDSIKLFHAEEMPFLDADYYELSVPYGCGLVGVTAFGEKIYYMTISIREYSNKVDGFSVYQYDIETKIHSLLYEVQDEKILNINELRADKNNLYWTKFEDGDYILQRYDINLNEVETIHRVSSKPIDQPIVLGGNEKYLTWYEYRDESYYFNIYNTLDNTISIIDEQNLFFDKYDRPNIYGSVALILKNTEKKVSFETIDVLTSQKNTLFNLSKEIEVSFPVMDKQYVVWRDTFNSTAYMYLYDLISEHLIKINCNELGLDLFSIQIYDSLIFINSRTNIFCLNLEKFELTNLTANFFTQELHDRVFSSSMITMDNQYVVTMRDNVNGQYYAYIIKKKEK